MSFHRDVCHVTPITCVRASSIFGQSFSQTALVLDVISAFVSVLRLKRKVWPGCYRPHASHA